MHRVLILGAGKIGALISGLLAESGSYRVQLGRRRRRRRARRSCAAHGGANLQRLRPGRKRRGRARPAPRRSIRSMR